MTLPLEEQRPISRHTPSVSTDPHWAWAERHDVQFYDDDDLLTTAIARFLIQGARVGQPLIVIATLAHRETFAEKMRAMGVDPHDLVDGRDIVWLDARETLSAFMEGGMPNRELFEATVGNVFEKVIVNRRYLVVRAYGEMVDLLWRDGKAQAAIELEYLWNQLARKYSFSLLCAYSKESVANASDALGIEHICGQHSAVLPHLT